MISYQSGGRVPLRAIPAVRRRQDVIEQLQELVSSGEWRPGDQLPPERELGEQLGVSRTVVREAIHVLAERGLFEVVHGRGTFVREPDPAGDISERLRLHLRLEESAYWKTTEARYVLEAAIARLAASRREDADLIRLRDALERMQGALDEPPVFVAADHEFHLALAAATQNEVFAVLARTIQDLVTPLRQELFDVIPISRRAQDFHRQIFQAVVAQDPDAAETAMRGHLDEMEQYLRRRLAPGDRA
jgi:GntR family transcriptional repressor for pyruvate dehydrogenase complex